MARRTEVLLWIHFDGPVFNNDDIIDVQAADIREPGPRDLAITLPHHGEIFDSGKTTLGE